MRAAIFIDGGYFFNHLHDEGDPLDYGLLGEYLLTPVRRNLPIDLMRGYFYYCAPWMSDSPDETERRRMRAHQELVDRIERTDRWQVRLGKLEQRWEGRKRYYEQKRVDVLLSVDLVRHAAASHIQHAVLVAGDSDFIPAIAAAKEAGVTVSLWCGPRKTVHQDLAWLVDELHVFDRSVFDRGRPDHSRESERGRSLDRPRERARHSEREIDEDRSRSHDRERRPSFNHEDERDTRDPAPAPAPAPRVSSRRSVGRPRSTRAD